MAIGLTVLFAVAIYLTWMPLNLGISVILEWILISVIFAVIFWIGFLYLLLFGSKRYKSKIKIKEKLIGLQTLFLFNIYNWVSNMNCKFICD